jgi:hypothetical protein
MGQFDQPIDFALKSDKDALFKWCFNRCYQAHQVIYKYEQSKAGSFWRFDDRYYESGIKILYERFCYAMAIVVDRFRSEWVALRDGNDPRFKKPKETHQKFLSFQVFLSGAVDEVFKRGTRDTGWDDGTENYCEQDYTSDEYEKFWEQHKKIESSISTVRRTFSPKERTYLHGFVDSDFTDDDDDKTWNLDSFHVKRVCERSGSVVVEKFLGDTKRYYLPTIIGAFMATPKTDILSSKPQAKWWQFWKK